MSPERKSVLRFPPNIQIGSFLEWPGGVELHHRLQGKVCRSKSYVREQNCVNMLDLPRAVKELQSRWRRRSELSVGVSYFPEEDTLKCFLAPVA
jgi:hypothetical protein